MILNLEDIGYKLPPNRDPTSPWNPQYVFHFMLTCDDIARRTSQLNNRRQFLFAAKLISKKPFTTETAALTEAKRVARTVVRAKALGPGPTQFDMTIQNQCYVILQLDPDIAWEFACGSRALTAKKDKGDYDFGLVLINEEGEIIQGDLVPKDPDAADYKPCRVVMFRLCKREETPSHERRFNVFVDLLHGRTHRMPTIFDPDIGNNGSSAIPP